MMLDEAVGDDMEPDMSVPDKRIIKEDLIQLLTALGIEEGLHFCVDNEEIFTPAGVVMGPPPTPFGKKTFPRWPDYAFTYTSTDKDFVIAKSKELEVEVPARIFPLIEYHSTQKPAK